MAFVAAGILACLRTWRPVPDEIWALIPTTAMDKPWANARLAPNGEPAVRGNSWFERRDGSMSENWDPTLVVSLSCETPIPRRALLLLAGRNECETTLGVYAPTDDRRVVAGRTWARYVRE